MVSAVSKMEALSIVHAFDNPPILHKFTPGGWRIGMQASVIVSTVYCQSSDHIVVARC